MQVPPDFEDSEAVLLQSVLDAGITERGFSVLSEEICAYEQEIHPGELQEVSLVISLQLSLRFLICYELGPEQYGIVIRTIAGTGQHHMELGACC
jgi:hypothetical protein